MKMNIFTYFPTFSCHLTQSVRFPFNRNNTLKDVTEHIFTKSAQFYISPANSKVNRSYRDLLPLFHYDRPREREIDVKAGLRLI